MDLIVGGFRGGGRMKFFMLSSSFGTMEKAGTQIKSSKVIFLIVESLSFRSFIVICFPSVEAMGQDEEDIS
jgi:hypothetical protein